MLRSTTGCATDGDQSSRTGEAHHIQKCFLPVRIVFEALARKGQVITTVGIINLMAESHHVDTRTGDEVDSNVASRSRE